MTQCPPLMSTLPPSTYYSDKFKIVVNWDIEKSHIILFHSGSFSQWNSDSSWHVSMSWPWLWVVFCIFLYFLLSLVLFLSRAEPIVCPIDLIKTILSVSDSDWRYGYDWLIINVNVNAHPKLIQINIFICWNSSFQVDRLFYRPGLAFLQSAPAVTLTGARREWLRLRRQKDSDSQGEIRGHGGKCCSTATRGIVSESETQSRTSDN